MWEINISAAGGLADRQQLCAGLSGNSPLHVRSPDPITPLPGSEKCFFLNIESLEII